MAPAIVKPEGKFTPTIESYVGKSHTDTVLFCEKLVRRTRSMHKSLFKEPYLEEFKNISRIFNRELFIDDFLDINNGDRFYK